MSVIFRFVLNILLHVVHDAKQYVYLSFPTHYCVYNIVNCYLVGVCLGCSENLAKIIDSFDPVVIFGGGQISDLVYLLQNCITYGILWHDHGSWVHFGRCSLLLSLLDCYFIATDSLALES